ncbi:unnamed protein product [Closterium sp. Naga37s-1]|nr:unnamed protein product [Closterium sp. Naga37s-1]
MARLVERLGIAFAQDVSLTSHPLPTPCLPSPLTRSSSLPLSTLRSPPSPRPPLVFPLTHPPFSPPTHPYSPHLYIPSLSFPPPHGPSVVPPPLTPHLPPRTSVSHPSSPPTYLCLSPLISLLFSNLSPLCSRPTHRSTPFPRNTHLACPLFLLFPFNVNHLCYTLSSNINQQCQPLISDQVTTFPFSLSSLLPHKHLLWAPSLPPCAPPRYSVGLLVTLLYPQYLSPQAT